MDPIPSVNRIFSLLIQEERQRDIGANSSTEPVLAFNIRANQNNQTAPNQFSNFKNVKKDSPYCTYCKRTGHTQDKCYRLHGFPPGYKTQNHRASYNSENCVNVITETQNVQVASSPVNEVVTGLTNDQCQQLIALLSGQLDSVNAITTSHSIQTGNLYVLSLSSGFFQSNVWVLDSGATKHVCNNLELFTDIKEISNTRIQLPNQSFIQVHQIGDIKVDEKLFLKEVLFVPQFKLNLIYVTMLTEHDNDLMVELYYNHAMIRQIKSKNVIGKGNVEAGLYILQEQTTSITVNAVVTFQRWHDRLGHPSAHKIKSLDSVLLLNKDHNTNTCCICPLAKQKRLPFVSENNV